jgi:hypothetical protein
VILQDALQALTVDSAVLLSHYFLAIQDSLSLQSAESAYLSWLGLLVVQAPEHSVVADNITLSWTPLLQVNDPTNTTFTDVPNLSQHNYIVVADSLSAVLVDAFGYLWYHNTNVYHGVFPKHIKDILYYGVSALAWGIYEVKVWPDGWGYILAQKTSDTDEIETFVDEQTLLHTLWGEIQIVYEE